MQIVKDYRILLIDCEVSCIFVICLTLTKYDVVPVIKYLEFKSRIIHRKKNFDKIVQKNHFVEIASTELCMPKIRIHFSTN